MILARAIFKVSILVNYKSMLRSIITIFSISVLFIFGTVEAQELAPNINDASDTELFQVIQDIETATPDERIFPEVSSVADVSELDAEERESLAYDVADWQANLAQEAAVGDFEMPAQCFDFYRFGSVRAPLSVNGANLASGTEAEFTVNLTNENPYPVVDANVYVKIFRERESGEESAQLAHIVDQFQAVEGITLGARETESYTFTYQVPASLPTGDYTIASFVSVDERFNLHGLPFTDDVLGDTLSFSVTGESESMIRWERDQVRVAGEQHYFASFIPEVSGTEPVRITALFTMSTIQLLMLI